MKSVVNNGFAGRSSFVNDDMFDGTAARELRREPRVIRVDRRGAQTSFGDNRVRGHQVDVEAAPTFREDMAFAARAMGVRDMVRDAREGSSAGIALAGVTPAAVAAVTALATAFGVLVMLL